MSGNDGIRRILAPTDFSDSASSAVDYAKLLAKRFGAGITLLHAAPPVATFEPLPLEAIALVGTLADERDRAPGGCMQPPERLLEFAFHHYARGGGGKREQRAVDIEEESPVWLRPRQDRRFGTLTLCWPNQRPVHVCATT